MGTTYRPWTIVKEFHFQCLDVEAVLGFYDVYKRKRFTREMVQKMFLYQGLYVILTSIVEFDGIVSTKTNFYQMNVDRRILQRSIPCSYSCSGQLTSNNHNILFALSIAKKCRNIPGVLVLVLVSWKRRRAMAYFCYGRGSTPAKVRSGTVT